MKRIRLAVLAAGLMFGSALTAGAQVRVYTGDEGNALLCAYIFSFSAVLMESEYLISTGDKEVMIAWSVRVLNTYVSGTWEQKMAAQEILAQRAGLLGTLQDFDRYSEYCFQRFRV